MDLSSLTGAIDLTAVGTAILAIGALMVVPRAIKYGVRAVLGMIGR